MARTKKDPYGTPDDERQLSLWLVPYRDSEIHTVLADATARMVPSVLAAEDPLLPHFEPHLTLATHIPSILARGDLQTWLDKIDLPDEVDVDFQELAVGDAFDKKLFIRCRKSDSLLSLASAGRKHSLIKVFGRYYDPHVSLL